MKRAADTLPQEGSKEPPSPIHGKNIIILFYYFSSVALLTFHVFKKAMLPNTGGNDRNNPSSGAVVVGDPKCADGTEVSVGVAGKDRERADGGPTSDDDGHKQQSSKSGNRWRR